jgi:bacterioferritin
MARDLSGEQIMTGATHQAQKGPMMSPEQRKPQEASDLTDAKELRKNARINLEKGAVTEGYASDPHTVVRLLNQALATELVCVLRYKRHHFMAAGILGKAISEEFLEHAKEEMQHADLIAQRITELGGGPDFDPMGMTKRSHAEYVECDNLLDMIRENLVAERIAIESYGEMIQYLASNDPTTTRMIEGILAIEEKHAEDLKSLLATMGPTQPVVK